MMHSVGTITSRRRIFSIEKLACRLTFLNVTKNETLQKRTKAGNLSHIFPLGLGWRGKISVTRGCQGIARRSARKEPFAMKVWRSRSADSGS
jgi:hypothetical protein